MCDYVAEWDGITVEYDGLAYIRQDLLGKENAPVGEEYYGEKEPLPYRFFGETDGFEGEFKIFYKGQWQEAVSIDWEFDEVVAKERLNIVPAKDTETLRNKVRDVVTNALIEGGQKECVSDDSFFITEEIFEALGITAEEQDIEGAKVCVNPKILITVRGGLAEACEYHPLDMDISIRDYDLSEFTTEQELNDMPENESGDKYIERF